MLGGAHVSWAALAKHAYRHYSRVSSSSLPPFIAPVAHCYLGSGLARRSSIGSNRAPSMDGKKSALLAR
eukprot:13264526-Alexandrium_andersonii.AAC.1